MRIQSCQYYSLMCLINQTIDIKDAHAEINIKLTRVGVSSEFRSIAVTF